MNNMSNPFTRDKSRRVRNFTKMVGEHSEMGLKKLVAIFCIREGTTKKLIYQYMEDLQDAGIIEYNFEENTIKMLELKEEPEKPL